MKKQPRYYQRDAATALVRSMQKGQIPYANLCTGSGKSLVSAMLTNWQLKQGGRVLQLVPTKELCEQNYKEAFEYVDGPVDLGICCSGLNKFDMVRKAIVATNGSFINRRAVSGSFSLCIIDECHLVTPDPDSTYRKIIRSLRRINPDMLICGMTATPYRMDQGRLEDVCFKGDPLFTHCVYESDIPRLISEGYLSHVESISGDIEIDTSDLKMSGTDYNTEQMGVKFDAIVSDAVADMKAKFETYGIRTALIFASTIANAKHILQEWGDNETMRIVHGDMSHSERASSIKWIKQGDGKRYIVNVGILTTGFDFQALDCVVLFFATKSMSKYIQVCGRVIRAFIDKLVGYVLDYGTNIERHGPIDATLPPKKKTRRGDAPKKVCLLCNTVNILSAKFCKECKSQFISESEEGRYSMRSKAEILAAKAVETYHEISEVIPMLCHSRSGNYAGTKMVKLKFHEGFRLVHEEYLMLDHPGSIANKSKVNFRSMFKNEKDFYKLGEAGHTVENAMIILENHSEYLKKFKSIVTVKTEDSKYKRLKWEQVVYHD